MSYAFIIRGSQEDIAATELFAPMIKKETGQDDCWATI